jgi:hypothetical protein
MVTISDQSINGLSLTAIPTGDLQGVVQMEGTVSLSTPGQPPVSISVQPNGLGRFENVDVKDDGTFVLKFTAPGLYSLAVNRIPPGAYMKALEYGELDVSDGMVNVSPLGGQLKVHLASDSGQLNGTVLNDKGEPAGNVFVNIIPAGRIASRRDLRRLAVSDQNGKFQQMGVAPGDYRVVAMESNDPNIVLSEDFFAELGTKAPSVTVHSGGNDSVEVKTVPAEEVDRIQSKL